MLSILRDRRESKGVLIQHHSVLNLSHGLQKEVFEHEIPSNMHVGLNASIAFDASIQQLQMLYGSSLYIIPNEVRSDGTVCSLY